MEGSVDLREKSLRTIPIKFNIVSGDFFCSHNELINLNGCPVSVGGDFSCHDNQIENLECCPTSVGGRFSCHDNPMLGNYQDIHDFLELKEKLISDKEKSLLSTSLTSPVKTVLHKV